MTYPVVNKLVTGIQVSSGVSVVSGSPAWTLGTWVNVMADGSSWPIAICGITFQVTQIPSADATTEQIIEIGVGDIGSEVTKIQIPYSYRSDTQVGYYLDSSIINIFLPEPFFHKNNVRIAARAASSTATQTFEGLKILYQEYSEAPLVLNNYQHIQAGSGISVGEKIR